MTRTERPDCVVARTAAYSLEAAALGAVAGGGARVVTNARGGVAFCPGVVLSGSAAGVAFALADAVEARESVRAIDWDHALGPSTDPGLGWVAGQLDTDGAGRALRRGRGNLAARRAQRDRRGRIASDVEVPALARPGAPRGVGPTSSGARWGWGCERQAQLASTARSLLEAPIGCGAGAGLAIVPIVEDEPGRGRAEPGAPRAASAAR